MKNLLGIKNINSPHPTPLPLVGEGIIACHYEEQSDVVIAFNKEITEQVRNDKNKNNIKDKEEINKNHPLLPTGTSIIKGADNKAFKKAGFTLVEILITLGIIGVVAAMTIPTLITNVQKTRTANQLRKAFAEISVAVRLAESEFGDITGWTYDNKTSTAISAAGLFDTYLLPFMKVQRKEVRGQDLIYYKPNNQRETWLAILNGKAVSYTLLSGVEMIASNNSIYDVNGVAKSIGFILDLNGYDSKPNRFGRDAFYVVIYPNRGVHMHYSDDGEYGEIQRTRQQLLNGPSPYRYQCNSRGRGMWCGAVIQKDGWKIAPDYPWN